MKKKTETARLRPAIALVTSVIVMSAMATACSSSDQGDSDTKQATEASSAAAESGHSGHGEEGAPASAPLKANERFQTLEMPQPYTPKAPTYGTDDYRCFTLDPGFVKDEFLTGIDFAPGNAKLVHHVVLYNVSPKQAKVALAQDKSQPGPGFTCFGATGKARSEWTAAWAPGSGEQVFAEGTGLPLEAGTQLVAQVHYNLLGGTGSDRSGIKLRLAPGTTDLAALSTGGVSAPIELPCRPGRGGPLCDRDAAIDDVAGRFGEGSRQTVDALQLACGGDPEKPKPGPTQTCTTTQFAPDRSGLIQSVAGHMHLLGKSVKVELNRGKPDAQVLLDIPAWNFDDQRAVQLDKPVAFGPGDTVSITCQHDQSVRDVLPALKEAPERYIVWGEGSTDEMCITFFQYTKN
jgi:Copper type II ascorbate-dependent monooxygenase, C-terminal domain